MNGFLYYLPNVATIDIEAIVSMPIAYAFSRSDSIAKNPISNGPDNQHGMLVSATGRIPAARCKYLPKEQLWVHHKASNFWVGMYRDTTIHPTELQRDDILYGANVELCDGNKWISPIARHWANADEAEDYERFEVMLPRTIKWDGGNSYVYGEVVKRHALLWSIANAVHSVRIGGETVDEKIASDEQLQSLKGSGMVFAAIHALQANYYIGPAECNLLGLFDEDSPKKILDVLCDWHNYEKVLDKKKLAILDGLSSSDGRKADSQDTAQACST